MRTQVLVVGAGPAGLSAALSVKHEAPELDVTVVESIPVRPPGSRAVTIFPATMEALRTVDAHRGIDHEGYHADAATFFSRNEVAIRADYNALSYRTVFPYITLLSQELTEKVLADQARELGVTILRGYKAISLKDEEGGLEVGFENGQTISADYVVGADGSKSTIRRLVDIPFYHPEFLGGYSLVDPKELNEGSGVLVIADITLQCKDHVPCHLMTSFHSEGAAVLVPIARPPPKEGSPPEDYAYRIVFGVEKGDESRARDHSDDAYIRDYVAKYYTFLKGKNLTGTGIGPDSILVKDILHRGAFRVRVGMATTLHKFFPISRGNLVVVGDAAHLHPPAGGQGVNLGVRDGVAAGKAIAGYHRYGRETESLESFKDFEARRLAETRKVVLMTRFLLKFWNAQDPVGKAFRRFTLFCASFWSGTAHWVALRLSGLAN